MERVNIDRSIPDEDFVNDLLTAARDRISDPRVSITHVHHNSADMAPAASLDGHGQAGSASDAALARAWRTIQSLATEFIALWQHTWISDEIPSAASVNFDANAGQVVARLSAQGAAHNSGELIASAADRLVVKGWFPQDDLMTPTSLEAQREGRKLTITQANEVVVVTLQGKPLELDGDAQTYLSGLRNLPSSVALEPTS